MALTAGRDNGRMAPSRKLSLLLAVVFAVAMGIGPAAVADELPEEATELPDEGGDSTQEPADTGETAPDPPAEEPLEPAGETEAGESDAGLSDVQDGDQNEDPGEGNVNGGGPPDHVDDLRPDHADKADKGGPPEHAGNPPASTPGNSNGNGNGNVGEQPAPPPSEVEAETPSDNSNADPPPGNGNNDPQPAPPPAEAVKPPPAANPPPAEAVKPPPAANPPPATEPDPGTSTPTNPTPVVEQPPNAPTNPWPRGVLPPGSEPQPGTVTPPATGGPSSPAAEPRPQRPLVPWTPAPDASPAPRGQIGSNGGAAATSPTSGTGSAPPSPGSIVGSFTPLGLALDGPSPILDSLLPPLTAAAQGGGTGVLSDVTTSGSSSPAAEPQAASPGAAAPGSQEALVPSDSTGRGYPGTLPAPPAWQYWLLLLGVGIAAPFALRTAIQRDEARFWRRNKLPEPGPFAVRRHPAATPTRQPVRVPSRLTTPSAVRPRSVERPPNRKPEPVRYRVG